MVAEASCLHGINELLDGLSVHIFEVKQLPGVKAAENNPRQLALDSFRML